MYRLVLESLLGLTLEIDKLRIAPCIPADWESFKLHYRFRETMYHIVVLQTHTANSTMPISVDGVQQTNNFIALVNDHNEHNVEVHVVSAQT